MEEEKIGKAFTELSTNIDMVSDNQERIVRILDTLENDVEEVRKQIWLLAQVVKRLKEEVDILK